MAERPVLRYGDPRLLERSVEVETPDPDRLRPLIADLWDTMAACGGIGIAAPQIGEFVRVVVFGMDSSLRYPEAPAIPRTVLVNPVIEPLVEPAAGEPDAPAMEEGWEGCLSVPGMRGLVPRHRRIRYSALDENGAPFSREAEGFHARVVQHECDHLDGVLYPLRVRDLRNFGFEHELAYFDRARSTS